MTKQEQLSRKITGIKGRLAGLGDMRPGSLTVQSRKWGGEYLHLSYAHRGKSRTEYIPQKCRKMVERQTANYRKFRELIQEWIDAELELCKLKMKEESEK